MNTVYSYKNLDKSEESKFFEYFETKIKAIKNLLKNYSEDSIILKANIEKFEKHDAFEVELTLTLPSVSIIAKEASHQITKAVDLSKDRLILQIKKHTAMLRKERTHQSIKEKIGAHVEVSEVEKIN